jgi:hypothetical protein
MRNRRRSVVVRPVLPGAWFANGALVLWSFAGSPDAPPPARWQHSTPPLWQEASRPWQREAPRSRSSRHPRSGRAPH